MRKISDIYWVFLRFYFRLRNLVGRPRRRKYLSILNNVAHSSGLYDKYYEINDDVFSSIGNRIWVFWYDGLNNAPPLVRKCVSIMRRQKCSDLIVLDKYNLENYFSFDGNIKELFEKKKISIQTFSDILRCQILSRHGGFWFDATLFVIDPCFVMEHNELSYFSIKHIESGAFTKGMWSTYGNGSGKGNPLFSFIYDMFIAYYQRYDRCFDYFLTDYIWLYSYENFQWAKSLIDNVPPTVFRSNQLVEILPRKFKEEIWTGILRNNKFQKLNWRISEKKISEESYLDYFLNKY